MNYLNEWDSFAAEWCRNLIAAGEIPQAIVDEKDIREVTADEIKEYVQCHFFAGVGGWPLALRLADWDATRPVWTVSCPCPPFSSAGRKKACPGCGGTNPVPCPRRTGYFICCLCENAWFADERHLWPEVWRLVRDCLPPVILGEQVSGADGRVWFAGVRTSLEILGYAVGAVDSAAASIGAPHIRQRLFWVAIAQRFGERESRGDLPSEPVGRVARNDTSLGSESGGLGDTQGKRLSGDTAQPRAARGWDGGQSGVTESPCGLGKSRQSRLAGRQGERGDDGEEREAAERTGSATVGVADAESNRTARDGGNSDGETTEVEGRVCGGRESVERVHGVVSSFSYDGPWSDYLVIPCRDGKNRRISSQPGDVPLAHGLPRKVGPSLAGLGGLGTLASDHEIREARASLKRAKRNRVGRLKGMGNAIVPHLAAEFIRTVMEILDNVNR